MLGGPPHAPVLSASISSSPRSGSCRLPRCGPVPQHIFNHHAQLLSHPIVLWGFQDPNDCIHSWPLIFAYFSGAGCLTLSMRNLCLHVWAVWMGCTSLLGASLGLIVWCRLVLHLIRGSFLPFLPVTHSSLPLLPSETVLSTGCSVRTGSSAGSLGHFGSCGAKPYL